MVILAIPDNLLTAISSTAKGTTTVLLSSTTPVRPRELCRLSMDVGFTSRYVRTKQNAFELSLIVIAGDPCQLGVPVQQLEQGGYFEPFPYICW